MRLAIVTTVSGKFMGLRDAIFENRRMYAGIHGYEPVNVEGRVYATHNPSWDKMMMARAILPHYDWVFWTDADAIITKFDTDLERFLTDGHNIILSKAAMQSHNQGNCGMVFLRNCAWTIDFLDKMVVAGKSSKGCGTWEQSEFHRMLEVNPGLKEHIRFDTIGAFNHLFWIDHEMGFITHYAGIKWATRVAEMKKGLRVAKKRYTDGDYGKTQKAVPHLRPIP